MFSTLGATSPLRFAGGFAISEAAVMSLPRGSLVMEVVMILMNNRDDDRQEK